MRITLFLLLMHCCSHSTVTVASQSLFQQHVAYLSSDELQGRGPGSQGITKAASYIEKQFVQIGLKPYSGKSFLQPVTTAEFAQQEYNVVGWIPAIEATDRSVVFMAHYDGLGSRESDGKGTDVIFNGARDNATGVAALIELAKRFKQKLPAKQNLVFVATTMEEVDLGGSRAYMDSPLFPLKDISMVLNIDGFNVSGPRSDFFVMPRQGINMLDDIKHVARRLGWHYSPPEWVDFMDKKFDTAVMLSNGVPAVTLWTGNTLKNGHSAPAIAFGDIHSVEDEINEFWDWSGVAEHLSLYEAVANFYLLQPYAAKVTAPDLFKIDEKDG